MPMASHARWRLADTAGGPSTKGTGACAAAGRRGGALGTVRVLMVTSLWESGLRGTRFRHPQPMSRGAPFHPQQAEAPDAGCSAARALRCRLETPWLTLCAMIAETG